jgi:hypothetical protein
MTRSLLCRIIFYADLFLLGCLLGIVFSLPRIHQAEQTNLEKSIPVSAGIEKSSSSAIKKISCIKNDHRTSGTAWHIGKGKFVTAYHVIDNKACTINGEPAKVILTSAMLDFAEVQIISSNFKKLTYYCGNFSTDRHYLSFGYPSVGMVISSLTATSTVVPMRLGITPTFYGDRVLTGVLMHGMSGGPIMNDDGQVVGINIATNDVDYDTALSRPLSDTALCVK